MLRVRNPRDIVNRKILIARLAEAIGKESYSPLKRRQVLALFKETLAEGRAELRRRFDEEAWPGPALVHGNAYLVDQLVRAIHDFALTYAYPIANRTTGERLSVAAVGGYGRGEMAPHSDVDLLFLLPYKRTAHIEQVVEYILYMLWDLGLTVGHATRSIDECVRLAGEDLTIRTSLLDARDLWGNRRLFDEFHRRYQGEVVHGNERDFVEAKLAERNSRHDRMGDTRYVLEPNIKEGKGGLRDLQTLFWIAKFLYGADDAEGLVAKGVLTPADAKGFAKAGRFLWTVRCHLHYIAGRAEERLTFDVQEEIGRRMGYADRAGSRGVERFMKHYYLIAKEVGDLTRILCAVLEDQQRKRRPLFGLSPFTLFRRKVPGFRVEGGRLALERHELFAEEPVALLRLFHDAQELELDIHPAALRGVGQNLKRIDRAVRESPEANRLFIDILTSRRDPELALRRMNEAGVLGRFVTEFGRVVAQMQYDMYHVYTVDEHTIRAVGVLSRIESGRLADEHQTSAKVVHNIASRRALYVAVLLHDIAKGRGGDHSILGEQVARRLCPRLGLEPEETETVAWLVRHHLLMSHTAFKRDVNDPKTVADFTEIVQSPERLRMLLVLTSSDIRAVGPGVWNNWKAGLLRELYFNALEMMTGGLASGEREARVVRARELLRRRLLENGWSEIDVAAFDAKGYPNYWLGVDIDTQADHARLTREADRAGSRLHIETRAIESRDATEIVVYTPDHPGLFSQISGAMALAGVSIVGAKVFTMADGMALDTFHIQNEDGAAVSEKSELERVRRRIAESLEGRIRLGRELAAVQAKAAPHRTRVFTVQPRVLIDNQASRDHTVIEVNGRDRVGFLYDVTAAITELNLHINRAHISTFGERVVDTFYVKDLFGMKIYDDARIDRIRRRLLEAIAQTASAPVG